MEQERFRGVQLPDPGFAGDAGIADPALEAALAGYRVGGDDYEVVTALAGARLLVPVVAVLDDAVTGDAGLAQEKDSHMATVTLVNGDGRRGLLAFTGIDALTRWRADARPVPATAKTVATAAVAETADAVLVDVAGPVTFALEGTALQSIAVGRGYQPLHRDPRAAAAVLAALASLPGPPRVRLLPAGGHPVDLVVQTDPAGAATAEQVADALATDDALAALCPRGVAVAPG